jgi:elongation factor P
MITSNHLSPGMTIVIDQKIYRVESAVMVSVAKGVPFIKTKLKNIMTEEMIEKSFKLEQQIEEVRLTEKRLEYLYPEGKSHFFLDIDALDHVSVAQTVIEDKVQYLKEGIQIKAMFYGDQIFSVELPQFLEIMAPDVSNTSVHTDRNPNNNDDSSAGHKPGDVWIYNANSYTNIYMCYKADVGDAQWAQLWTND